MSSNYFALHLTPKDSDRELNRLDENYNSPKYLRIEELLSASKFHKIVPLGNSDKTVILKSITSGKTPPHIKYLDEGIPFIGASNIFYNSVDSDEAPRISSFEHESRLKSSQINKNDLLISIAGTVGRCAVYSDKDECNCNQAVAILKLNCDEILPDYAMFYLNSEIGQLFFGKLQHISDQPNINLDEIKQIKIVLPDIDEQKQIVIKCNQHLNNAIKLKNKINQLKQSFDKPMRDALTLTATSYENILKSNYYATYPSDLEKRAQRIDYIANNPLFSWMKKYCQSDAVIPLGEIIDPDRFSYGVSESSSISGIIGFLSIQHISFEGRITFNPPSFINTCPDKKILSENDILIARTGYTLGKAAIITKEFEGFSYGSFCIRFSLKTENYYPDFIAQYINSIYGQTQIMMLKAGSDKKNINQDHIAEIRVPILDKRVQEKILEKYSSSLNQLSIFEKNMKEDIANTNTEISQLLFNNY